MKGADGMANRLHVAVGIGFAAAPINVIAAPLAGFQICVFSISLSNSAANNLAVFDDGTTDVWRTQTTTTAYTNMANGTMPLFVCADATALRLASLVAGTLQINIGYEIRPTGL